MNRLCLAPRRGVILLVVLALLALFAVVGIAFVMYAQSKADAARIFREAETKTDSPTMAADIPPDILLAEFLRQFIYDLPDDQRGSQSALRGHSLARTMFGYNDAGNNTAAFNGVGRRHAAWWGGQDEYNLVNYVYFQTDGQMHDPEREGWRAPGGARGPFAGGFNPSYTYPDLNMMCLAAVDANGNVLIPSYHRSYTGIGPLDPANPNWGMGVNDPSLKYKSLRFRQFEMSPSFPLPGNGGDVKNLVGGPGGNDSVWLSLGYPVQTLPDGRKFVPLFAPLVIDLDNRININIHGNHRGQGLTHRSNQGFGPWSVSVSQILNANGSEWRNIFNGNGTVRGRYGNDNQPGSAGSSAPADRPAWFFGQFDFDGVDETGGNSPTQALQLPGNGNFSAFPTYPGGWGNASAAERSNHPMLFDIFSPAGDDRVFDDSNMMGLLRDASSTTDLLKSDLGKLCPTNFTAAGGRRRRLVTTRSFDLDHPAITPWIWDPTSAPYQLAAFNPNDPLTWAPRGGTFNFPTNYTAPPPNSEFDSGWRAASASRGRIDLNRDLAPYPPRNATGRITDMAAYDTATKDRQSLAREIFDRLRQVTGAADPASAVGPEKDAVRWLAQLAVNIVDFRDEDDYMTPFQWNPAGNEWVFGVEVPRLVLNEAYCEITNDPTDPGLPMGPAQNDYFVNFWVELHNPMNNPCRTDSSDDGSARLQVDPGNPNKYAAYTVVVAKGSLPNMRDHSNSLGDPDPTAVKLEVADYDFDMMKPPKMGVDINVVRASNGAFSGPDGDNQGFYLLGPVDVDFPIDDMNPPMTSPTPTLRVKETTIGGRRSAMMYKEVKNAIDFNNLPKHTILLRRLACPGLPPQNDPTQPNYNPYVTIDYIEDVPSFDGIKADDMGMHMPKIPVDQRRSVGRRQPYSAHRSEQRDQAPNPPLPGQPQHTFFRHNSIEGSPPVNPTAAGQTLIRPFDWLVHLNRQLVSPMELLEVCGFKPHELTQQFMVDVNNDKTLQPNERFLHRVPWFDEQRRVYRVFEFLECKTRSASVEVGGRIPGKININTIWDAETFRALCDPQQANSPSFDMTAVNNIFNRLRQLRNGTDNAPGTADDRPFRGLASAFVPPGDPQYPVGSGLDDTFLRPNSPGGGLSSPRLFENQSLPPGTHPYIRNQLLNKIYGNVTTRSNVFAVWVTVGFFEVIDDSTLPVRLGAEIGAATGQNIRHHMFAIVDRSALTIANTAPLTTATNGVPSRGFATVTPASMSNIDVGTILTVDSGANAETIIVLAVNGGSFTAKFEKTHSPGFPIYATMPGNPGPQPTWEPRDNNVVVPYYMIVD
ncbi:MAG: hypothetical protein KatS3mg105_4639 [Gemmatales bacterium]|nr:MAG: hypothetical protein KatS3mg105_4639 [Gemmatales bacterium]